MVCELSVLVSNIKGYVDLIEEGIEAYLFKIHKEEFLEKFELLIGYKNKREYFVNIREKEFKNMILLLCYIK